MVAAEEEDDEVPGKQTYISKLNLDLFIECIDSVI